MAYSLSSIFISFFYVTLFCSIQNTVLSFSVDLIHRDSPQSPLYNPSLTHYECLNNSFHRSITRASYFRKKLTNSTDYIQSQILPSGGAYVMKLSIGTPPVPAFSIADTGSDITWTQCKPCPNCFAQVSPLFDPARSSTFRKLPCDAKACTVLESSSCSHNTCQYSVTYGDQSYSFGDLASDTFTIGSTSISNVFFGCGHNNEGTFNGTSTGLIGLGGGAISFVQQLGGFIGGKFSYCLAPLSSDPNVSGKINFGDSAIVSGLGVVSTPLIKKPRDTFYYLTLESISVGSNTLIYEGVTKSSNGFVGQDIIIDSGTTLTMLPSDFIENLVSGLKSAILQTPVLNAPAPFSLCYKVQDNITVPVVMVKFTGAELRLSGDSIFIKISDELVCLAFIVSEDISIYGNLAQMNYLVGYDLVNKKVSFKPTDCSKN